MSTLHRALPLSLAFAVLSLPLHAQPQAKPAASAPAVPVDHTPWLYKGSDIKQDPDWHFGTLPNGLRYAVRRNNVPPGQVAIRVRIDAGSLMEEDSERGFAHLNEHLAFRGTATVPDGEQKRIWQRLGAAFGSDTNAETTPTQTVYKLDLPGATEASLDQSLTLLADMMAHPNITQATLDSERPVVLAEQREIPAPQQNFGRALYRVMFAGQRLANRLPDGNVKTLEAATPASVRVFHDRWYRPERTVVVIAGDLDPAVFERLIAKDFAGWRGVGPAPADPDFGTPDPSKPVSSAVVEPAMPATVAMAIVRPWHYRDDLVLFNQKRMIDRLAARIVNRRLETRARAGASYVEADVDLDDISRTANVTNVSVVPVGDDWKKALHDVRAVIADAEAAPPSQAEIDRELAELDAALKNAAATWPAAQGVDLADTMVGALDIRETTTDTNTEYAMFADARAKHMFTPAAVLESTRRIFTGTATRGIVATPTPDADAAAQLAAALKAKVSGADATRTAQATVDFSKLPPLGKPGVVTSRANLAGLYMEQIGFSNGVRLMFFPNDGEKNRVYVRVRFGTGLAGLPGDRVTPAWAGPLALVPSGVGSLGQDDLDALTAGRRIDMDFSVDDDAFSLSAMTTPDDLADQLRLMATKLAYPNWDAKPVERARAVVLAQYAAMGASPDGVLSRDLDGLLHGGDPRWATPPRADVAALTPEAFKKFWAPILASGPIEVQVFGDVRADAAIDAVAKSLGALAPRPALAAPRAPVHGVTPRADPLVLTDTGPDNQAIGVIAWPTGGGVADMAESRRLDLLAAVFQDRLMDRLRTEAGASYSPQVASQWPEALPAGGALIAIAKVPPGKTDFFFGLARNIAADLAATPLDPDELKRIQAPILQALTRNETANTFWMRELAGATYDPARVAAARDASAQYSAITAADLQATARRYLKPNGDWALEIVPKATAAKAGAPGAKAMR